MQSGFVVGILLAGAMLGVAFPATVYAAEGLNLFPEPWKVAIHVTLFLVIIYPTTRFLLRPLVRVIEERERRTEGALDRMDSLLGEAAELRQTLEVRLDTAREEAQAQRAGQLQQVEEDERRELTKAREHAERRLQEARVSIAAQVESARESLRAEADGLARDLASRVLGRKL